MKTHRLHRDSSSLIQTHGRLTIVDEQGLPVFSCFTLELPWMENKPNISCIPKGEYPLAHRNSPKYGDHIHVMNVPGRSYILIHPANFVSQLRGCIAPGDRRMDLNADGTLDVANSKKTMDRILPLIQNGDKLLIT